MSKTSIILGILMLLFLTIALIAISLIFSPATLHTTVNNIKQEEEIEFAQSGLTTEGLLLRVDAWKTYPKYNIGLGIIAGVAFAGTIYACRAMFLLRDAENEAL